MYGYIIQWPCCVVKALSNSLCLLSFVIVAHRLGYSWWDPSLRSSSYIQRWLSFLVITSKNIWKSRLFAALRHIWTTSLSNVIKVFELQAYPTCGSCLVFLNDSIASFWKQLCPSSLWRTNVGLYHLAARLFIKSSFSKTTNWLSFTKHCVVKTVRKFNLQLFVFFPS